MSNSINDALLLLSIFTTILYVLIRFSGIKIVNNMIENSHISKEQLKRFDDQAVKKDKLVIIGLSISFIVFVLSRL